MQLTGMPSPANAKIYMKQQPVLLVHLNQLLINMHP